MNLRHIVPALGLVAMTSASAFAADAAAPAVTFGGWVDTVLQYSDDDTDNDSGPGATEKDESSGSLRFTGAASLKAKWNVTNALTANVNLWFDPGNADNNLNMREAYFTWGLNDTVSWSMGKYIDHIGWIAAEPTGPTFLFINADTIGYRQVYGNDVLGTAIGIAPKGSPISGAIHITNGYYTGSDATSSNYVSDNSDARENTDLGFGLDLTFALPNEMGNINAELAYDMHSGDTSYLGGFDATGTGTDLGGDVLLVGINATIKPVKTLTIGAELMFLTVDDSEESGPAAGNGIERLQGLLLANVAIPNAPANMSVTGLIQYVSIAGEDGFDRDQGVGSDPGINDEDEERLYVGVALLTNPLQSSNFGLNFEIGFFDIAGEDGVDGDGGENNGMTVAVEGLVSF